MNNKGYLVDIKTGKVFATVIDATGRGRMVQYFFQTANDGCPKGSKSCMLSFSKKHKKYILKKTITNCAYKTDYFGDKDYYKVI